MFLSSQKDIDSLSNWNFNILKYEDNINEKYRLIFAMFEFFNFFEKFEINSSTFAKFLCKIQEKYNCRKNPFHNFDHGFTGNVLSITFERKL